MKSLIPLALLAALASTDALARSCSIDLDSTDQMKFDRTTVTVSSGCPEIVINLTHSGKLPVAAMGHNVAIAATGDYKAVAQDGVKAGLANDYLPPGDARVIAYTRMIGGGETATVSFAGDRLVAGGDYTFFCSFPGHWALMVGKLVVE